MAKIKSVTIRRFKRLADITLELGSTSLLIGSNNAGKSSVLQAMQFAVSLAQSAKLVGGVQWQRDKYELSFSQTQLLYCPVSDAMTLASGGRLVEDEAQPVEVVFVLDDNSSSSVSLRKGRNRNLKVAITGRQVGEQLQDLMSPFSVYAPGLAGISRHEQFINAGLLRRIVARGDANLALRNVLLELSKDEGRWETFLGDMRFLFPRIEFEVHFAHQQDEHIGVMMSLDDGPVVPLDAGGTSILQASQLLSYVTLFRPKLLILDEPDSHLHPDRQRRLCELLCDIAEERDFQVVMSTHSRHVLDSLSRRAKVFWLSAGSIVPDENTDTQKLLLELGALDSVDYFADGQTRCLVATEDTHTEYLTALLESSGFPMDDVHVASYQGCSKVDAAIVLGCFLREKAPHIKLIVHRDRDYMSDADADEFEARLRGQGIHPWITRRSDIEGHFLSAEHFSRVVPGLVQEDATRLLNEAIEASRDLSLKAIVDCRTNRALYMRNRGGPAVNSGQIAVDALHDLDGAPVELCRGTAVLGRVVSLIQQHTGVNPRVVAPSVALDTPTLRELRNLIWV